MRMRLTFAVLDAPPRPEPRFSCASAPPLPAPRPGHVSPASLLRRPRPARVPPAPHSPRPARAPRLARSRALPCASRRLAVLLLAFLSPAFSRTNVSRETFVRFRPPPSLPLPSLACAACHPASPPALSCGVACPRSRLRYARPRPCPRSVTPASFESFCSCLPYPHPRSAPLPPPTCAACSPCLRACAPRVDRRARFCYSGENTRRPSAPARVLRVGRAPRLRPPCPRLRPRRAAPRCAAFPRRCHGFPERRLQRGL